MAIPRPRDDIRIHTHRNIYEGGPIFASALVDDGGDPITLDLENYLFLPGRPLPQNMFATNNGQESINLIANASNFNDFMAMYTDLGKTIKVMRIGSLGELSASFLTVANSPDIYSTNALQIGAQYISFGSPDPAEIGVSRDGVNLTFSITNAFIARYLLRLTAATESVEINPLKLAAAANPRLLVRGTASQTGAFQSWQTSADVEVASVAPGIPGTPSDTTASHIRVGRPDTGRYWWMKGGTTPDFNLDSVGSSRKLLVLNSVASYWADTKETVEFRIGDSIASRKDAALIGRSGNPFDRLGVSSQYTVFTNLADVALPVPVGTERVRIVGKLLTDTAPQVDIASAAVDALLASIDVDGNTVFKTFAAFTSAEFVDSAFRVIGSADATRKWGLEVDGLTTSTTRLATVQDFSATLPAIGNVPAPPFAGFIGKVDLVSQAA